MYLVNKLSLSLFAAGARANAGAGHAERCRKRSPSAEGPATVDEGRATAAEGPATAAEGRATVDEDRSSGSARPCRRRHGDEEDRRGRERAAADVRGVGRSVVARGLHLAGTGDAQRRPSLPSTAPSPVTSRQARQAGVVHRSAVCDPIQPNPTQPFGPNQMQLTI